MIIHSGQKSYFNDRGKVFSRNSDLKRHMITHTCKKSYQHSFCEKAFIRDTALGRHMITHTGKNHINVVFVTKLSQEILPLKDITHT